MLSGRKTKLAASFVVTVSASVSALGGCRKQPVDPDGTSGTGAPRIRGDGTAGGRESAQINRYDGHCTISVIQHCPKGMSCNPPPPTIIDCPPDLLDVDAGEKPGPTARPPGKEDWVRVQPRLWAAMFGCSYQAEWYCAGPPKPYECTKPAPEPALKCKPILVNGDAGATPRYAIESFVYQDGLGTCHEVPPLECGSSDCLEALAKVTQETVPCPAAPPSPR